ncbi:MAG: hypothetical protein IJS52_08865 [Bacilli bacterium]|nr:hypothetical protein [Bacilli bacterium]
MKRTNLLILTLAAGLLASCGSGSSSAASASSGAVPAETSQTDPSSSRTRVRSSTSPVDVSSTIVSSSEESLPVIAGTEITYVSGLASGGESAAKEDPGVIYEWHGDGGNITDFRYDATKGEYSFYYTAGWAWYGCQFFYRLPYSEAGDSYTVRLQFYSDVAGEIRVNGQTVSLSHGWNVITQEITLANANDTVVSVQLGIPGDEAAGIPAGALPGSLFKFRAIEVYDAVNTYHEVAFKVGEDVVKDIKVREGKTVAAPKIEAPEGTILSGWFDGEDAHSPSAPVTAAHTYTAKFVDKSEVQTYDVTVKLGDATYAALTAVAGQAVDLTSISAPFGYGLDGFFLDAAFQTPYENTAINEATTLYLKTSVTMTTYYHNGEVAREERKGPNGEFICEYHNNGFDAGWNIQLNFKNLPKGVAGKTYVLSLEYTMVGTENTGTYQIYDNGSVVAGELPATSEFRKVEVEYAGGTLSESAYFTMELGACKPTLGDEGTVVVTVCNPLLVEKA